MALPQLNTSPSYSTKVPSTGETIHYRPYLVKEEKVLMIAFETGDQKQALRAIVDTLKACIVEEVDLVNLCTFDIEYLFTQIRSKSVGETADITLPCSECESRTEVNISLQDINIDVGSTENVIELTDNISIEMRYPAYRQVMNLDVENSNETELGFTMLSSCITAILTEEERVDTSEVPQKEVMAFIEQMTTDQFKKVSEFLQNIPTLNQEVRFTCSSCGHENQTRLKGINDFLS